MPSGSEIDIPVTFEGDCNANPIAVRTLFGMGTFRVDAPRIEDVGLEVQKVGGGSGPIEFVLGKLTIEGTGLEATTNGRLPVRTASSPRWIRLSLYRVGSLLPLYTPEVRS